MTNVLPVLPQAAGFDSEAPVGPPLQVGGASEESPDTSELDAATVGTAFDGLVEALLAPPTNQSSSRESLQVRPDGESTNLEVLEDLADVPPAAVTQQPSPQEVPVDDLPEESIAVGLPNSDRNLAPQVGSETRTVTTQSSIPAQNTNVAATSKAPADQFGTLATDDARATVEDRRGVAARGPSPGPLLDSFDGNTPDRQTARAESIEPVATPVPTPQTSTVETVVETGSSRIPSADQSAADSQGHTPAPYELAAGAPDSSPESTSQSGGNPADAGEHRFQQHEQPNASLLSESAAVSASSDRIDVPAKAARIETPLAEQLAAPLVTRSRMLTGNGRIQFEMELDPPELGTIVVHLTKSAQGLSAKLIVAQEVARAAIESQLSTLEQALENAGIQLTDFSLSHGGDGRSDQYDPTAINFSGGAVGHTETQNVTIDRAAPARSNIVDILA